MDPADLGEWFAAHGSALVLYSRQWLRAADAEDVVQEIFARLALEKRQPENIKAWLFTCVRRAAIDQIRRNVRRSAREKVAMEERPLVESSGSDLQDARELSDALELLPPRAREIITLKLWADMTFEEIAQILGLPRSSVHAQYTQGLGELKARWRNP